LAAEETGGLTGAGGGGSTAVQIERWGATVVEQRSSRGHRQGGRGSSRRQCRARAVSGSSEGDRGDGSRWLKDGSMTAQWRRRGGGGKRVVQGGCSFYSRWKRERHGGGGEPVSTAKWQRPQLECRRHGLGTDVQTVRLTGGPHVVLIFF
jgi:hypothetical protein